MYKKVSLSFRQRDSFKLIDNRPESAVHVAGPDCNALFNFLLNCRSLVNNTGELAGVPPSLIAPVPFKSATLMSLLVSINRTWIEIIIRSRFASRGPVCNLHV